MDKEALWREQLAQTRANFERRVYSAVRLERLPGQRQILYMKWRREIGDDLARESAKFSEAIIAGRIQWPKWFTLPLPY